MKPQEEEPQVVEIKEEEDVGDLHDLVDASLRFTTMLKKKGVSQATLTVAVRNRPLSRRDRNIGAKASTRVVDDKVVVVMDPKEAPGGRSDPRDAIRNNHKAGIPGQGHKDKEKRYVFDRAFDTEATNQQVYKHVVQGMIGGLLKGLNATIFAYGATGSGKTHTMVGTERDPGMMVLSLRDVFRHISREPDKQWEVTCSYLEVYNEEIYDLLTPSTKSKALDLREDPELGPQPAGLKKIRVTTPEKIFSLLKEGNRRRKTESTDANETSSRSHAVLEVVITRTDRNHYEKQVSMGKLALVDLAGSERASETNNRGHQLKDGANINRSLLALANCINALGKRRKKGFVFVPFRNSKLTRLLKDGLCGNSRTAMVATVSCANTQYHHTLNTLKYADRAKEIKTHVRRNQGTVQEHVVEYQRIIDSLQRENQELKEQLAASDPAALQAALMDTHPDDALWVESTSAAINKAAVERLAQHRDVEGAEDAARRAAVALGAVEAELDARDRGTGAGSSKWSAKAAALSSAEELQAQRAALAAAADASKQDRARLSAQVAELEAERTAKMAEVASAPPGEGRERLKLEAAAARRELERVASKENLTTCDAVIKEQAAVISNLWKVLEWAGVSQSQALDLAAQHAAPQQQQSGPPQHELALGTLAHPPAAAQHGVVAPVGTVRLEQLLTGSAAQQLYAQWTDHRESSRHSLSTPDAGPRRQSLSLNKSQRSSNNAANIQKLQRRMSSRSSNPGPAASRSSQQQQHPGASSAPKSAKVSSTTAAAASAASASSRGPGSRSAAPLRTRAVSGKKKAAPAADPSDPADPGSLSAEQSEWVEVTESDVSDTGGGRVHPRARHPGSRIPANANPNGSYSSSARPRANSHRDGTSTSSTNIPRYAGLRRSHRPKSSNVKVRLSGTLSRPQSSNQARKPHQPLSAKVAPTQPKPTLDLPQAASSIPLDMAQLDTPTQPLITPTEPVPESPNAWGPQQQEQGLPGQQQAFGFSSGAGYSADTGSRRDTKDSVDEEARPETSLPEHHRRSPERRSPDPKALQQQQEQGGGAEGPPPAASIAVQGRNPSARAKVRNSAESDITPTTAPRPNQVAPAHHQRNVSRSFDPATLQQQQQQQQQQQPPKSAVPPRLEVNVALAEKQQEGGDPALSKMISPTRRGISKLLSLSRIRRRSSTHAGQGQE